MNYAVMVFAVKISARIAVMICVSLVAVYAILVSWHLIKT